MVNLFDSTSVILGLKWNHSAIIIAVFRYSPLPSTGEPSLSGRVTVFVTVTDAATPVFSWSQYRVVTPENVPLHTAIASLEAHSPASHKLIYSIVDGNVYDEFSIDFNIGS